MQPCRAQPGPARTHLHPQAAGLPARLAAGQAQQLGRRRGRLLKLTQAPRPQRPRLNPRAPAAGAAADAGAQAARLAAGPGAAQRLRGAAASPTGVRAPGGWGTGGGWGGAVGEGVRRHRRLHWCLALQGWGCRCPSPTPPKKHTRLHKPQSTRAHTRARAGAHPLRRAQQPAARLVVGHQRLGCGVGLGVATRQRHRRPVAPAVQGAARRVAVARVVGRHPLVGVVHRLARRRARLKGLEL